MDGSYLVLGILFDDGFQWLLLLLRDWFLGNVAVSEVRGRSDETEHYGQDEESIKKTEDHNQEEDFEKDHEDVRLGACQEDKGQEGGESSIEDGRTLK